MDIETIKDSKNKHIPYLICGYNGSRYITSFGLNQKVLFAEFIKNLLTFFESRKRTLTVYTHNLSNFDGIFLMNQIIQFGKVKPQSFHGRLISLNLILTIKGHKNKTLIFKDSMLMLPLSLRQLCDSFKVKTIKSYFPYAFTNIFYTGVLPQIQHWSNIPLYEYQLLLKEYTGIEWNFKKEAVKYCKLDCQALHEILVKFNELIYSNYKVNISGSLTLPSLAMKIYSF